MVLDVTTVDESATAWLIRRNPGFTPLPQMAKTDPKYPSLRVTPGINREATERPVRPVLVEYGKDLAPLDRVLDKAVPAIRAKEASCTVCKAAAAQILGAAHTPEPPPPAPSPPQEAVAPKKDAGPLGFGLLSSLRPERPFRETLRELRPRLDDIRPTG